MKMLTYICFYLNCTLFCFLSLETQQNYLQHSIRHKNIYIYNINQNKTLCDKVANIKKVQYSLKA